MQDPAVPVPAARPIAGDLLDFIVTQ